MKTHKLKTWPEYFDAVDIGSKRFEIRKDDRGFKPLDILILKEWRPETEEYSGHSIRARVDYVLRGGKFGIEKGYVAMSITVIGRHIKIE